MAALVERDRHGGEIPVHLYVEDRDGLRLDVDGARTGAEMMRGLHEEFGVDPASVRAVRVDPEWVRLCCEDGLLDPITPESMSRAEETADRLLSAHPGFGESPGPGIPG